jgi:hypothetical protein
VPGSTISNNVVRSKTNARFGTGILDMPAASSAAWTIEKNQFVNLARERS